MSEDFFDSGLLTFCEETKRSFYEMSIFHKETEDMWSKKDSELQEHIAKRLEGVTPKEHGNVLSGYGEELHLNQLLFPNVHRSSLVISLHTYLEDSLDQLHELVRYHSCKNVKYKSRVSTIERYKSYIVEAGDFNTAIIDKSWFKIDQVNKLRNKLIHENGRLPKEGDDPLNVFVSGNEYLSGVPDSKVHIASGFIGFYIETLLELFENLDVEVAKFSSI
jgi:hypothetical protein